MSKNKSSVSAQTVNNPMNVKTQKGTAAPSAPVGGYKGKSRPSPTDGGSLKVKNKGGSTKGKKK